MEFTELAGETMLLLEKVVIVGELIEEELAVDTLETSVGLEEPLLLNVVLLVLKVELSVGIELLLAYPLGLLTGVLELFIELKLLTVSLLLETSVGELKEELLGMLLIELELLVKLLKLEGVARVEFDDVPLERVELSE